MKILSAELHDQAFTPTQIPSALELAQVAVFGRSNVGKSSLLAVMMQRKKLVKVSGKPGKTRGIFFYRVNDQLLLVDLPGYGFSKAPRVMTNQWETLVEAYLDSDPGPSLALHLIDIRHPPTRDDLDVSRILSSHDIPTLVVATKADKLSRSQRLRSLSVISRDMGVEKKVVIPVSARDSALGPALLWEAIIISLKESL